VALCPELDMASRGDSLEEARKISSKRRRCSLRPPMLRKLSSSFTLTCL